MLYQSSQLRRKVRKALKFVVQESQADDDVAQQLAFGTVAETAVVGEFSDLANIVQDRAGQQQIQVDEFIMRGHGAAQIADR